MLLGGNILHWGNPQLHAYGLLCCPHSIKLAPFGQGVSAQVSHLWEREACCGAGSLPLSVSPQGDEVSVNQFGLGSFTSRRTPTPAGKSPAFPTPSQDGSANLSRVGFKFNMVFTRNLQVNKRPTLWQTFTQNAKTYFKVSQETTWFLL